MSNEKASTKELRSAISQSEAHYYLQDRSECLDWDYDEWRKQLDRYASDPVWSLKARDFFNEMEAKGIFPSKTAAIGKSKVLAIGLRDMIGIMRTDKIARINDAISLIGSMSAHIKETVEVGEISWEQLDEE